MFYKEFQSFKNPGDNLGQFFHLFPTWTVEMLTKCSDCLKSKLRNIHKIKHKGSQNFKEPLLLFKVKIISAIPQKKQEWLYHASCHSKISPKSTRDSHFTLNSRVLGLFVCLFQKKVPDVHQPDHAYSCTSHGLQ